MYRVVIAVRNKLFDLHILRSVKFNFPVICVGNITVGGTGKTPHVEHLIRLLEKKFSIAVLSRGYRRKTKGYVEAGAQTGPEDIGDEPYQMFVKCKKATVAVDENRVHGIRKLSEKNKDLRAVLLDDAFQHRYVEAGLNIVLVDYYRPVFKDHMLPYGNLREPSHGIHRANIVIVTKVPHHIKPIEKRIWIKELDLFPYQFLFFTCLDYGSLQPVFSKSQKEIPLKELDDKTVLVVSGIGNPLPLINKVRSYTRKTESMNFPDHHDYKERDIRDIVLRYDKIDDSKKIIVTTEKDAVKLSGLKEVIPSLLKEKLFFLPVQIKFLDDKQHEFDKIILNYVEKNKRVGRLHK